MSDLEERINRSVIEAGLLGNAYFEHRETRESLIREYADTHTVSETVMRFHTSDRYIYKVLGIEPPKPVPIEEQEDFGPINFGF